MQLLNRITLFTDKFLDALLPYYIYSIIAVDIIYVIVFIGIINLNGEYLTEFNIFIQLFVCLFLIFRFNPFRKPEFRPHDAHVIFGSATFLLLNLGFVEFFKQKLIGNLTMPW